MKIICQNKKASHDYFLLETFEAGIKLKGTEIKSIREGKGYGTYRKSRRNRST